MHTRREYERLAYQLMELGVELIQRDGLVATWAPDQPEPETHICVYEVDDIEHSADCDSVSLHLQNEVYREDADIVERSVWAQEQVTPLLDDETSLLTAFAN